MKRNAVTIITTMRKILTAILFILVSHIVNATDYYVSPSGSDSNPGTILSPFASWQKLSSVLVAGDRAFIRGGTYRSLISTSNSATYLLDWTFTGNSGAHITISAYQNEKPIFNMDNFTVLNVFRVGVHIFNCTYTDFIGLRITGLPQVAGSPQQNSEGTRIEGGNQVTFTGCEWDHIQGPGCRVTQNTLTSTVVSFTNCDAHHNGDPRDGGGGVYGNADGFDANGGTVSYRGCRAWWNSDDGFDCFYNDAIVTYDSCWSFFNGYVPGTFTNPGVQADGMGYKWGLITTSQPASIRRTYTRCISFMNKADGYDQNTAKCIAQFYNCVSWKNARGWALNYAMGGAPPEPNIIRNCISYQDIGLVITETTGTITNNTWNGFPATSASFASLDTTGVTGARQSNGSLPSLQFLHLSSASNMIDIGVNVGLPVCGIAPDLGAYEYCGGGGTPLAFTYTTTSILCNGSLSTIGINATGGQPSYQYSIGTGAYQTSNQFTRVAGTYVLNVKDITGTIVSTTITITQPTAITVTESHTAIAVNGNTSTVTVTAGGGTSTLSYKLETTTTYQSSNTFTGVAAGNHTITVRDASLCTKTLSFTITQPSILALSLSASAITCNMGTSTITATASGATPPYRYKLGTGSYQTSNSFTSNRAGTYTVTCTDTAGAIVSTNVTITEPTAISVAVAFTTAPSTVTVTSSGGVGTLNYKLDATGTYQVSNIFTGVAVGTHTITVRDANLCTNTKSFTVVLAPLRVTMTVGTITCNGGLAAASGTPTGGASPYTYLWSNGITTASTTLTAGTRTLHVADAGTQVFDTSFVITQPTAIGVAVAFGTAPTTVTVTATSAVGTPNYKLDAGAYQASNTFLAVAAGAHTVTVRDANLCTATKTFTVTTGGTPLAVTLSASTILCNAGTSIITATATGGTAPYMYKLSTSATYVSSNLITVTAGTYTVNVIDALGATVSANITITQPAIIGVSVAFGTAPTTVTVTATGGVPTLNYKLDAGSYQAGNTFANVAAGTHTVTVRDGNLCTVAKSFTVLSSNISVSLVVGTISCNGGTTTATATVGGGTTPYFYLWSNNQTTATATGLTAGTRTLHVTDNASHVFDTSFVITQPSAIVISAISFTAIAVNGGSTTVTVTASGGVTSRTFSLDGGAYQSSNVFAVVLAGNHTMDVKDANGCIVRRLFSITQPGVLIIHVNQITTIDCFGDSASMGVTATGGTPPYVGVDTFNVAAGTRTYTVTDAFGSISDSIVTVTQPTAVVTTVRTGTIAFKGGTTYVKILGTGGTGSYTFQLDGSGYSSTDSVLGVLAGTHTAYVKDANGCVDTYSFNLKQPNRKTHIFIPAANLYFRSLFACKKSHRKVDEYANSKYTYGIY